MSRLVTANLDELPSAPRPGWVVTVEAPGPFLRVGERADRHARYAWRRAARLAVEAAQVPALRVASLVVEVRLDLAKAWNVQRWLPTATACGLGLGDACQCLHQMLSSVPRLTPGHPRTAAGEVVLHITGERR